MKLTVYLHQNKRHKLGVLAEIDKKIYFEYDKAFLESGIEVSPFKLPLKNGVIQCNDSPYENLFGVFADSLPDGWGRLLIDRELIKQGKNPNLLSPLERLKFVGCAGMGALEYEPFIRERKETQKIVLKELANNSLKILEEDVNINLEEFITLGGSSAGARPKILAQIDKTGKKIYSSNIPLKEKFKHYIIKFASSFDGIESGKIEFAYSKMAKKAGIEMSDTLLLEDKYFAIERFDREGEQKIHMHSFAGLVHSDFRYPTLDYDDLLKVTALLTKDINEVKKAFRIAVFNLLTYNRDDHAKNFSFLMDNQKRWHLTPAYDLTFSLGMNGEHSMMYMGEGRNPTTKELLLLGKKHKISDANLIIKEIKDVVKRWGFIAHECGVSKAKIDSIQKFI